MQEYCSHCGFKFQIEPSFFYGAMYVSYAITVALSILTFVLLYLLGFDLLSRFIGIIISLIIFTPLTLRLARLIYSNIFVSYDSAFKNEEGLQALGLTSKKAID